MSLVIKLIGKDKLSSKLQKAIRATENLAKGIGRLGLKFAKMGAIGAAGIGVVSVKLASDLDKGLREISTLMDDVNEKGLARMGKELQNVAARSGQALDKLVKARYDIVSAGFADAAESAKLLNASAMLAVGGVTEVNKAADLLTTSLNAYNLTADQSIEVSDKLFTIVRLGKTTIDELSGAMGQIVALSGQMGISIDEVGAAMATLTASGQSTRRAATAIRQSFVELIKPGDDLRAVIKKIGFETGQALVDSEGYAGALKAITNKANELDIPLTDLIGSVESMQAILPLTGTAAESFARNLEAMKDSAGATQKAYEKMQKSFAIVMSKLKVNISNAMIAIGKVIIEKIQPKIEEANKKLETLGQIGWDVIGSFMSENLGAILSRLAEIASVGAKIIAAKIKEALFDAPELNAFEVFLFKATVLTKAQRDEFQKLTDSGKSATQALIDLGIVTSDTYTPASEKLTETLQRLVSEGIIFVTQGAEGLAGTLDEDLEPAIVKTGEAGLKMGNKITEGADAARISLGQLATEWAGKHKGMTEIIGKFGQAFGNLHSSMTNLATVQIKKRSDKEIQAVLNSTKTEEEKQAEISNIREQARKDEEAQLKKLKPLKLAQAISNIALGVTEALGAAPPPFNLALAAITVAAGAIEISAINASPFEFGGRVRGQGEVPIIAHQGEGVSTGAAMDRFGDQILRFNDLAETGEGAGSNVNIIINALDGESVRRILIDNTDALADAIFEAVRRRDLPIGSLV